MDPKKMVLESWSLSRPKMVKALKKVGVLEEAAQRAEDLALDLISDLVSRGIPFELARERGLGRFIYLPQEPEPLSPDQMPLMPQQTT
jgi:hypothetical protein